MIVTAAEVEGVDFTKAVPPDVIQEVRDGITKYGVLVFRRANLDDDAHVEFASNFGELEPTPAAKLGNRVRLPSPYIGDLANVDFEGKLVTSENRMGALFAKGNEIWHKDMMYHPRRCHFSTLRSVILPPEGTGGETLYADSRAAYEALSQEMKDKIENMVANCSLLHNRRKAAPELYPGVDPYDWPIARYKLVYPHEGDGRKDLYVSTYMYQIDGLSIEETQELVDQLIEHATQEKFIHTVHWHNAGDMVMWGKWTVIFYAPV